MAHLAPTLILTRRCTTRYLLVTDRSLQDAQVLVIVSSAPALLAMAPKVQLPMASARVVFAGLGIPWVQPYGNILLRFLRCHVPAHPY